MTAGGIELCGTSFLEAMWASNTGHSLELSEYSLQLSEYSPLALQHRLEGTYNVAGKMRGNNPKTI